MEVSRILDKSRQGVAPGSLRGQGLASQQLRFEGSTCQSDSACYEMSFVLFNWGATS